MGITHITVNLCLWNQGSNGIHDHDINRTGTHHGLCDLQSLLTVVRLGNIKIVDIYPDVLGIDRIQRMLCINKACDTACLLYLCDSM